jgi:hypothetical protein
MVPEVGEETEDHNERPPDNERQQNEPVTTLWRILVRLRTNVVDHQMKTQRI